MAQSKENFSKGHEINSRENRNGSGKFILLLYCSSDYELPLNTFYLMDKLNLGKKWEGKPEYQKNMTDRIYMF